MKPAKGLIPSYESIKAGDLTKRREQMAEMFEGFWRACIEPTSDDDDYPFIADAIIANPPSLAHVHCAEKLGIPLHLMFTFPYSPTQTMPHPLAMLLQTGENNLGKEYTNSISYSMIDMLVWQGLGDLINRFREKTLGLDPVATLWAPGMLDRLKVPFSYMWSPALIPKPHDWGDHIDVTGFVFLDLASSFSPPEDLSAFLEAGPPPVYIGFGSIVVDDPEALTQTILSAAEQTGVRVLLSKGWGELGGGEDTPPLPDNIFILGNIPHDWLFSKVSAVVHHGGAGTTAIGLYHGKPTMIVPFFGDQQFWGEMVASAGAGAKPVPHKELTADNLAAGIRQLLSDDCQAAAQRISEQIRESDGDGADSAVRSFFARIAALQHGKRGLGFRGKDLGEGGPGGPGEGKWGYGGPGIRCDFLPEKVAVWRIRRTRIRLSALAASILVRSSKLTWRDLRLVRHTEWSDYNGPGEPVSGGISALFRSTGAIARDLASVPASIFKRHKQPSAHGLTSAAKHAAEAPADFSLAVAQGFHNAPRLLGDTDVRRPPRITGIHSGLRAAGKEFSLGIYDAATGLAVHPYQGGGDGGGAAGAVKGVATGIGSAAMKTAAAATGAVAYVLAGAKAQARRRGMRGVVETVVLARVRQGEREWELEGGEGGEAMERVERKWVAVEEQWGRQKEREKKFVERVGGVKVKR